MKKADKHPGHLSGWPLKRKTMKDILQPLHFQTPERPKEENDRYWMHPEGDNPAFFDDTRFNKDLAEWEYHQVRYTAVKLSKHTPHSIAFYNDDIEIYFNKHSNAVNIIGITSEFNLEFKQGIHLEEFELILKNRGINLKK